MKKNPIVIFTGLAVAAVAGVAGLTRDQWLTPEPPKTEIQAEAPAAEVKQPESQQAAAPVEQKPAETKVVEQPASEPQATTEAQKPAEPVQQQAAAPVEQKPAETRVVEQPASVPQATAEVPKPAEPVQQQAAAQPEASETPAQQTQEASTEAQAPAQTQPEVAATSQQPVAPAAKEPATEAQQAAQSTAEQPAAPEPQQAQAPAAEPPAPETQQAAQPAVEPPAAPEVQQAELPATEQPVQETQQAAKPPPEQPAQTDSQQAEAPVAGQPVAEQQQAALPSTEQLVPEQPATAEASPAPEAQQVAQPAVEPPAAPETHQAEAPAAEQPTPETQQAAQPAPEQPAQTESQQAEAPAAERPAAEQQQAAIPSTEQPVPEQPEVPKSDSLAVSQPAEEPAPTFDTVRIEKTGEAVIAGQAQPGDQVEVKLNGETIGQTTATSDGSFVVVPEQPIPAGSGSLTIESKGEGETMSSKSEQMVAVIVPEQEKDNALVAVVSPDEPTKVLQKPESEKPAETATAKTDPAAEAPVAPAKANTPVSLDTVDYDAAGNIVFSGRGQPGTSTRIYIDNAIVGDAPVGTDGRWVFSGTTTVAPGVHQLRIDGIDGSGKVLSRIEAPFFREETTKVASAPEAAPDQPAAKADLEPVAQSGASSGEQPPQAEAKVAAAVSTEPAGPKEGRLVIQPGNNLWRISRVIYGSGSKYALLYEANKDQIRDPDLIYPGQVFRTPDVLPPETIDPTARDPMVQNSSE